MRKWALIIFFAASLLAGCIDEPAVTIVHTGIIKDISEEGALFTGSIQGQNKEGIQEYGFVWSLLPGPTLQNSFFKKGGGPFSGVFEQLVQSELEANKDYYVRAYVVSNTGTAYGETAKFKSKGSTGPVIISLDPTAGSANSMFTIKGEHFSFKTQNNRVKVGSVLCTTISSSDIEIKAQLPAVITISGSQKVTVEVGGKVATSPGNFILAGPNISSITPLSGIAGTLVTIQGSGFSAVPGENIVSFGQNVSPVITASLTSLTVNVPQTNLAGPVAVTVRVNGVTGTFASLFSIEGPEIFTVSPSTDYPGKTMTITGKNFSADIAGNIVRFAGSEPAKVLQASATELKVEIPFYLSNSAGTSLSVSVTVLQITATKTEAFVPLTPWSSSADFAGQARAYAAGFVIDGIGYLGTGTFSANCACYIKDFWAFNPQTNSWTQKADFGGSARAYSSAFSINGKGYITGGTTFAGESAELWEYRPDLNQWTRKNDTPGHFSVFAGKAFTIGNDAYYLNGYVLYKYDAANDQWIPKSSLPANTNNPYLGIAFGLNGKGYATPDGVEFYSYDPILDTWTRKADAPLTIGGYGFVSFSLNGKGYVGSGGYFGPYYIHSIEFFRYDPVTDIWQQIPSTPTSLQHSVPFEINGFAYYGTGRQGDFVQKGFVKLNPNF